MLDVAKCRVAGIISRPNGVLVNDIAAAVSMSDRALWPEMDGSVQLLPAADSCMHMLIEYSLLSNVAEQIIASSLPNPPSEEKSMLSSVHIWSAQAVACTKHAFEGRDQTAVSWQVQSLTPKDMNFIEAKHVAAREIALALGVPPMLLHEIVRTLQNDPMPVGPSHPLCRGLKAVKEFMETEGNLPKSIAWVATRITAKHVPRSLISGLARGLRVHGQRREHPFNR